MVNFLKVKILYSLAFMAIFSACEQTSTKTEFENPVPEPNKPLEAPPPTIRENPPELPAPEPEKIGSTFVSLPPVEVQLAENSAYSFYLKATSDYGGLQFYSQCPFDCPETLSVNNETGEITFNPSFSDSGIHVVEFLALDGGGFGATSHQVKFFVSNVNRAPILDAVRLATSGLDPVYPGRSDILSCLPERRDLDGDKLINQIKWFINDEPSVETSANLSLNSLSALDSLLCEVVVKDESGLESEVTRSLPYIVPNTAPSVVSLVYTSGAGSIRVGDASRCEIATQDLDGDTVSVFEAKIVDSFGSVIKTFTDFSSMSLNLLPVHAHRTLKCIVSISDGAASVVAESPPVKIANAPPVINSLTFVKTQDSLSAGSDIRSGDWVVCQANYSDSDGDSLVGEMKFFVNGIDRGSGSLESFSSSHIRRRYKLRTRSEVTDGALADTRGKSVECRVRVSDIEPSEVSLSSTSLPIVDSAPVLSVASGSLNQTIFASQAISPVIFTVLDNDGDIITLTKANDSCANIAPSFLALSSGSLSLTSLNVPLMTYPHANKSCIATLSATANALNSNSLTVNVSVQNRAPVLSCGHLNSGAFVPEVSPLVRVLEIGKTDQFKRMTIAGQELGLTPPGMAPFLLQNERVLCRVTDPDGDLTSGVIPPGGEAGDSFAWSLSPQSSGCVHSILGAPGAPGPDALTLFTYDRSTKELKGKMALGDCLLNVSASDGSLSTQTASISALEAISPVLNGGLEADALCRIKQKLNTTKLGAGVIQRSVTSLDVRANFVEPLGLQINSSEISFSPELTSLDLNYGGEGLSFSFTIFGDRVSSVPLVYSATSNSIYDVVSSSISGAQVNALSAREIGKNNGSGSQTIQSNSCHIESSCSGRPASLAVGSDFFCYLSQSSEVYCRGSNLNLQAGQEAAVLNTASAAPVIIDGGGVLSNVRQVSSGRQHACALTLGSSLDVSGRVFCWGTNSFGQLGNASPLVKKQASAVKYLSSGVETDLSQIVAIASGEEHSCALTLSGELYCWGLNDKAQSGISPASTGVAEMLVSGGRKYLGMARKVQAEGVDVQASSLWAGGDVSCYRETLTGNIRCFGETRKGQLGYTNLSGELSLPEEYTNPRTMNLGNSARSVFISKTGSLAQNFGTSCLITEASQLLCFGEGGLGQLGTPSNYGGESYRTLTPNPGLISASHSASVALSKETMCYLDSGGGVNCVGGNSFGELGSGDAILSSVSYRTVKDYLGNALEDIVSISGNNSYFCGVKISGDIYCWGNFSSVAQLSAGNASTKTCTSQYVFMPR